MDWFDFSLKLPYHRPYMDIPPCTPHYIVCSHIVE